MAAKKDALKESVENKIQTDGVATLEKTRKKLMNDLKKSSKDKPLQASEPLAADQIDKKTITNIKKPKEIKPVPIVKEKAPPKEKVVKVKAPPKPKAKKMARPTAPPKPLIPKIEKIGTPIPLRPHKVREVAKPMGKVVIPKTTYKASVTYQPDFVKSVLDEQAVVEQLPSAPTLRYSDVDLAEFRELINRKLDSAKKELGYLQGLITRKDEMGGDNDDSRYMTMEDGSLSMEREQLSQMASRQIMFVDHLEKAIIRVENRTYGICRVTGKLIDKARLRAVPHATMSLEAKMGKVK